MEPSALAVWDPGQNVVLDPTEGLVQRQQEAYHQRFDADRKLIWYDKQRELDARLAAALQPKQEAPVQVEELPPAVVERIFDSVTADPAKELAERRDLRRSESLAVHLEQILACSPPAAFREALGGRLLRLAAVVAPEAHRACDLHLVYFEVPEGQDGDRLQRRLNRAAPLLAAALARRLLVAVVPQLRFVPCTGGALVRRQLLWRVARRERRARVHGAMRSWIADMHF